MAARLMCQAEPNTTLMDKTTYLATESVVRSIGVSYVVAVCVYICSSGSSGCKPQFDCGRLQVGDLGADHALLGGKKGLDGFCSILFTDILLFSS